MVLTVTISIVDSRIQVGVFRWQDSETIQENQNYQNVFKIFSRHNFQK